MHAPPETADNPAITPKRHTAVRSLFIHWIPALVIPSLALYAALSVAAGAAQSGHEAAQLAYSGAAMAAALGAVMAMARPNGKAACAKWHAAPFWGLFALGLMCESAIPSPAGNWTAAAISTALAAAGAGVAIAALRHLSLLLLVPGMAIMVLHAWLRLACGIEVDGRFLAQVLAASPQDAAQFTKPAYLAWAILAIAALPVPAYLLSRWCRAVPRLRLLSACGLSCLSALLSAQAYHLGIMSLERGWDIGTLNLAYHGKNALKIVRVRNSALMNKIRNLPSPADQPSTIGTLKGNEGVVVVLHIGESLRADRLSLNGYARKTTPWLETCPRLVNFRNCTAAAWSTPSSTLAILTNARGMMENDISPELEATTGCIMDIFAAHGFSCYGFFSSENQDKHKSWGILYESLQAAYTARAKKMYTLGEAQGYMPHAQLPQIRDCLATGNENKFLLVNNMGSHIPFTFYDSRHAMFQPADGLAIFQAPQHNREAARKVNNAYDNTVAYTDSYIRSLTDMLKGKPFLYVYISDHGEPLGDGNTWVRTSADTSFHQTKWSKVPFFIISSPEFEALHPHFGEALGNLGNNRGVPAAHENIFHTLLGIFGIKTPYYDEKHDLSAPNPEPYQGPSCDRGGKALDGLKWE